MKVIHPQEITLKIDAPRSKSAAHRILLAAALCDTPTRIDLGCDFGEDVAATLDCLAGIGAQVVRDRNFVTVTPKQRVQGDFPCRESGSTLRFFLPVAAAAGASGIFSGKGRLPERPLQELLDALAQCGVKPSNLQLPLFLSGKLPENSKITLPGNVSSQYVTGFLFALAAAGGGEIILSSKLQSVDYVNLTTDILQRFGITVKATEAGFAVSGKFVSPQNIAVEGDWSNSAAYLALGAVAGRVTVKGLDLNSRQGDRRFVELLRRFGAKVTQKNQEITVKKVPLSGAGYLDVDATIDLAPVLAVVAAKAKGITTLGNARRLRIKESDRLAAIRQMLTALKVQVIEGEDFIEIYGNGVIPGGCTLTGCNDHRIVMAATLAGIAAQQSVSLTGWEAVNKSLPDFFTRIFPANKEF